MRQLLCKTCGMLFSGHDEDLIWHVMDGHIVVDVTNQEVPRNEVTIEPCETQR